MMVLQADPLIFLHNYALVPVSSKALEGQIGRLPLRSQEAHEISEVWEVCSEGAKDPAREVCETCAEQVDPQITSPKGYMDPTS